MSEIKLLFKQRMFSWFDSFDIYDESGEVVFVVKGQLAWGHLLRVYDRFGNEIGMLKERIFTFLPRFQMYIGDQYVGEIKKEFTFFRPVFTLDCYGWQVDGNFLGWDYNVHDAAGNFIMQASKQLFNWTDTYTIDVPNPDNALISLLIVLAIDAEKCSRSKG